MIPFGELVEILAIDKGTLSRRAAKESWPFQEVAVRGGQQKLFPLRTLPIEVQRRVRVHLGELPAELADGIPISWDKEKIARCAKQWGAAEQWQRDWATHRAEILKALERYRRDAGATVGATGGRPPEGARHAPLQQRGRRAATDQFAALYNSRQASGIDPALYDRVKRISRTQLYEWERKFKAEGIAGLISRNGQWKRGGTILLPEQQKFLVSLMATKPDLSPVHLHGLLQAKFNGSCVCETTVRQFLRRERERDPRTYCLINNPDEYRSRYQVALGNRSERAERFLHYVEVDSTPGDVKCSDGRRYNICGLIDVFSRCARFVVSPTSNAWAIAGLLWAVCTEWGIPEHLVRDNGQDYASRHINEALTGLECAIEVLPPFTPEAKPHIERMFRTLLHGLFPLLSGYVGHNVAERKAIENRKSFADRLMKRGQIVEIGLSPAELQKIINKWTENRYHQRRHSELNMPPNAKRASVTHRPRRIDDPAVLALALSPREHREVSTNGIRYDNGHYWDDPATAGTDPGSLVDWVGRKIVVVVDLNDAGRLFCFDPDDRSFICTARDMAISGITIGEKIAAKKRANKIVRERAKALEAMAKGFGDPVGEEPQRIIAGRDDRLESLSHTITNLPVGDPIKDNPFINACFEAVDAGRATEEGRLESLPHDETPPNVGQAFQPAETGIFGDTPDNPKVVKLRLPEPEEVDLTLVTEPITIFELLRVEQRRRKLTDREVAFLRRTIREWQMHAWMTMESMPERDRVWLTEIAPEQFEESLQEENT